MEREPDVAVCYGAGAVEAVLIRMAVLVRSAPQIEPKAFSRQYCGTC